MGADAQVCLAEQWVQLMIDRSSSCSPSLGNEVAQQSASNSPKSDRHFRADIQALRAWAVSIVIFNHAKIPYMPGGFLGVDIFFVISGYLITNLMVEALNDGTFSLKEFYGRRVRRLLPAAYCTFLATALAAPILLDNTELKSFVSQLASAFTITANFEFWKQVHYFGTGALTKPLLHIWSLSLEEQYYFIFPIILYLSARPYRIPLTALFTVISITVCVIFMSRSSSAAFYLLPSRAWELGMGSLAALLSRHSVTEKLQGSALRPICVAVLLTMPLIASERGHPGIAAAIVCSATAVFLLPNKNAKKFYATPKFLILIGNRSYSLYLVHWPLFAFANNIFVAAVPASVNLILIGVTIICAELQYRLVEQRYRSFEINRWSVLVLFSIPLVSVLLSFAASRWMINSDTGLRVGGYGLAPACDYKEEYLKPEASCASGAAPRILLWGDSFAMALAPGLAASAPYGLVQATKTVCGPFLDLSPISNSPYNRLWGERCAKFNRSVLNYIESNPHITTIVLSSALAQYVPGAENLGWRYLLTKENGFNEQPQSMAVLLNSVNDTVSAIRRLGRRVVLIAPPPAAPLDIARCHERTASGRPTITHSSDCTFPIEEYRNYRYEILNFLNEIRTRDIVPVITLDDELCQTGRCQTRLNGIMLYRDKDHLSAAGSLELGTRMHWGDLVDELAR